MAQATPAPRRPGLDFWVLASDPIFYLAAILVAGGLIWLAMSGEQEQRGFTYDGQTLVIEGEALAGLVPGPGTEAAYVPDEQATRMTANASFDQAGTLSAGVGLLLPRAFEESVIGHRVEVDVEIRAMRDGHDTALVAYFTAGSGDSPRMEIPLSDEWQTYSFAFDVPETAIANDEEWIGFWPDVDGLERPVLVRRIEARITETPAE